MQRLSVTGPKVSFDHQSHMTNKTASPKSRHGFYSEFSIVKPVKLQSTYSLQSLKDETFKGSAHKCCSLKSLFPILRWLPYYELVWFKQDCLAAITVAILLVPQVLAYAVLAGLPPECGLYASVVPVALYGIWSTSTKVAVGPGAPSAIMLASAVNSVITAYNITSDDDGYSEMYQEIAMTFTFCCGIIFIILGLMRAGFVIVFLSRPVMTGFILSASFIIVLSQCRSLMGLDIDRYPIFYINLIAVINNIGTIHLWTSLISFVSLIILFLPKFIKRIPRWVPIPLIVILINILLSYFLDFESLGVSIVGAEIKAGFPHPKIPNFEYLSDVFSSAFVVTVVDYMSNIVLANSFEQKTKDTYQQQLSEYNNYIKTNDGSKESKIAKVSKPLNLPPLDVDANMEFLAYGIANLFGSWFNSQIISASFSRTALNYETSAQTRIASFIRIIICILCLLFLMPFLSPLPKCVLASVVCTAVYRLMRDGFEEMIFLYKVSKLELFEFSVSVIAPLVIGMEMGIFLAIGTSIIVNLLRHTFANVIFLGSLQTNNSKKNDDGGGGGGGDIEYVNADLFKEARHIPYITIIEMKAELSFSNNLRLVNKIRQLLADNNRYIVVSLNLTSFIDTTAIRQIVTLFEDARGSYICLSQCRQKVVDLIRRYQKSVQKFPENVKTFISTHDAVRYLQEIRHNMSNDDNDDEIKTDDDDIVELSSVKFDNLQDVIVAAPPISPAPFNIHQSPASLQLPQIGFVHTLQATLDDDDNDLNKI